MAGEAAFQAENALSKTEPKTVYDVLLKLLALAEQDMLKEITDELRKDLERVVVPPSDDTPGHLRLPFGGFNEPEGFAEAHALYLRAEQLAAKSYSTADEAQEKFGINSHEHVSAEMDVVLAATARKWAELALRNAKPASPQEAVMKLTALMEPGFGLYGVRELKAEALEVAGAVA